MSISADLSVREPPSRVIIQLCVFYWDACNVCNVAFWELFFVSRLSPLRFGVEGQQLVILPRTA